MRDRIRVADFPPIADVVPGASAGNPDQDVWRDKKRGGPERAAPFEKTDQIKD
jgi:hypothetical protein